MDSSLSYDNDVHFCVIVSRRLSGKCAVPGDEALLSISNWVVIPGEPLVFEGVIASSIDMKWRYWKPFDTNGFKSKQATRNQRHS